MRAGYAIISSFTIIVYCDRDSWLLSLGERYSEILEHIGCTGREIHTR